MNFKGVGALVVVASMLLAGVVAMMPSANAARPVAPGLPDDTMSGSSSFGRSVAADGGWTAIGAHYVAGAAGFDVTGVVRVYFPSGDSTEITSPAAVRNSQFGLSVAIHAVDSSNAILVVGAPAEAVGDANSAGRAYIYQVTTNSVIYSATLVGPAPSAGANFGWSVATDGQNVLVGAPFEDSGDLLHAGIAYIFSNAGGNTWNLARTLYSNYAEGSGYFGYSVAIASSNRFIVAAPWESVAVGSVTYTVAGRVYYFESNPSYATVTVIDSPNPSNNSQFGYSIAATTAGSDWMLVVGAPGELYAKGRSTFNGVTYIYRLNGNPTIPAHTLTIVAKKIQNAGFGYSVGINGTRVIVGAPQFDASRGVADSGQAFIYALDGTYVETLASLNPVSSGQLGFAVALDEGRAVVSQFGANNVYVYDQ